MDIFIEQIIECKTDRRGIALKIGIIAGMFLFGAVFVTAAVIYGGVVSVIALAAISGVIWLGVNLFKGLTVEYEYILTNKELDIDKIIGRRKRKRLITLDLTKAEKFDVYSERNAKEAEASFADAETTVSAHDNTFVGMWYLTVRHDVHGKAVLLFNPNDAFIIKVNNALPSRAKNRTVSERSQERAWS